MQSQIEKSIIIHKETKPLSKHSKNNSFKQLQKSIHDIFVVKTVLNWSAG